MSVADAAAAAEPVRRSSEIEDPTNLYFVHPLSALLVPIFARLGVTPNAVSLLGLACGVLAGVSYHFYQVTGCSILGFLLMLAWHVMDGADGQLARLTRTYSEFGKVLDGICDYVTFTAVYVGLGLALSARLGPWVIAIVALSGVCHALQSATYELQRQNFNFWGLGRQSAALPELAPLPAGLAWRQRLAGQLHLLYTRVQLWASGGSAAFNASFAVILATRPEARAAYCGHFAPLIRRWGVLGSNYRTLGIFLAALLKMPLLYFFFEIICLSLVLVFLLKTQECRNAQFLHHMTS